MAEVSNRRHGLFIDKRFQSKFIAVVVVLTVAVAAGAFVLWFASSAGGTAGGAQRQLGDLALVMLLVMILLLVIATVFFGLRFSHRIVGPVYAINRHLNWIREGSYTRDLQLRKKDEFQNLAQTLNAMQAALRRRARSDLEALERVDRVIAEIKSSLDGGDIDNQAARSAIDSLSKEVAEIRKRDEGFLAV